MKNKSVVILTIGLVLGYSYKEYSDTSEQLQVYGSRDIESDIKKEVSRVNTILDDTESKHIKKKNVPKPSPPAPEIACKCNGSEVIVQADGNKVQCQCFRGGATCKCTSKQTEPELVQPKLQDVQVNP